jgi:hypothetical protein
MAWIQYLWKWLSTASPIPLRIAEIIFFLITIVGLAMRQLRPQWEPKMVKIAWQLPLGILIITFLISLAVSSYHLYQEQTKRIFDLNQQLDNARKQAYPPITALMMEPYFKDKDIPLGDFGLVNTELTGKTFENCRIHGIVVLVVGGGTTITGCHLSGNMDASFIITTNEQISGVLKIIKCTFIHCSFKNVSFIGNVEMIKKIKAGFTSSPTK